MKQYFFALFLFSLFLLSQKVTCKIHIRWSAHKQTLVQIETSKQNTWVQIQTTFNAQCLSVESALGFTTVLVDCDPLSPEQKWKFVPNGNKFRIVPQSNPNWYISATGNPPTRPYLVPLPISASNWNVYKTTYNGKTAYRIYNEDKNVNWNCQSPNGRYNVNTWTASGGSGSWNELFYIETASLSTGFNLKTQIPDQLLNVPVQFQTNQEFNGERKCMAYYNTQSPSFESCDFTSDKQKWKIEKKYSTFLISPKSNSNVFLRIGESNNQPITLASSQYSYLNWYIPNIQKNYIDYYSFFNPKIQAGLYYSWKDGGVQASTWIGGWQEDHYLFRISKGFSNGFPYENFDKWVILRENNQKLCYEIDKATSKLWTQRCDSNNKYQRFKFQYKDSVTYIISNEAYPNMVLIGNDKFEILMGQNNAKNQKWTAQIDSASISLFQLMNVDLGKKTVTANGGLGTFAQLQDKSNTAAKWMWSSDKPFPLKSTTQCRNDCQAIKSTNSRCGKTPCCLRNKYGSNEGYVCTVPEYILQPFEGKDPRCAVSGVVYVDGCELIDY